MSLQHNKDAVGNVFLNNGEIRITGNISSEDLYKFNGAFISQSKKKILNKYEINKLFIKNITKNYN